MGENLFKNNTGIHGYDFYTVKDHAFVRNILQVTNGATTMDASWIFPKLQAGGGDIMFNYADIPTITSTNDSIIQLLNAWEPNYPISYNITQRCEYNFVRTGGAQILHSNGDNDSALPELPQNILANYIKRNTFIGGTVASEYYTPTSNTKRHTYLESNVIINSLGGATVPPSSSAWFFVSGINVQGTPAAGLVDANGNLVSPTNHGKSGREIWRPE